MDGFSKLCLSCHDGTVAIGSVISKEDQIETTPDFITEGDAGYLGTDLSGGHPVSIVYDLALVNERNRETDLLHLNWPIRRGRDQSSGTDPDVRLYPTQGDFGVQCTSCHDPHGGKGNPDAPPFWRKTTYDEVCLVCHMP
ncbi:MAG: cytochrome c3 family protein [Nitrospirota bacterium]